MRRLLKAGIANTATDYPHLNTFEVIRISDETSHNLMRVANVVAQLASYTFFSDDIAASNVIKLCGAILFEVYEFLSSYLWILYLMT